MRLLIAALVVTFGVAVTASVFAIWPQVASASGADLVAANSGVCDPARQHSSGDFNESITSGGLARTYLLHVPPSYSGQQAVALVLNLHMGGSTAQSQADMTQFPAKSDLEGFIVVMPQASDIPTSLPFSRFWNYTTVSGADDLTFISDLLDRLETQLCLDTARFYVTGLSSGAMMSVRLGCSLSDRIAAIAPVAGVYFPPRQPGDDSEPAGCPSSGPVSIIAMHGKADTLLPYLGGTTFFGQTVRSIPDEIMPDWAAHNGCSSVPEQTQLTTQVERIRYTGCAGNSRVELYALEDGGHGWGAAEVNATDLIWDFFASQTTGSVGGIAELPEAATAPLEAGDSSGVGGGVVTVIAGAITVGALALGGAAWFAMRRSRSSP